MKVGLQRLENAGLKNDGGGVAAGGAYIDFGPRTGWQAEGEKSVDGSHDSGTRQAKPN